MRVKIMLALLAIFGVLSAETAFAGNEELIGLEWRVVAIRYEDGELRETLPNTTVSALFSEDGNVSGSAGCNRYFAAFNISCGSLKISPAGSTRKLCSGPKGIMEQEAAFLRALSGAASFRLYGGRAALLDSKGEVALMLADVDAIASERQLAGFWRVESMNGKKLIQGTEITMAFTEDGRIAGKSTINRYFASWIESDGLILFTQAGTTMMAGPEAHMRQEAEFLKLLGKVRKYKLDGDHLTLKTADGALVTAVRAAE